MIRRLMVTKEHGVGLLSEIRSSAVFFNLVFIIRDGVDIHGRCVSPEKLELDVETCAEYKVFLRPPVTLLSSSSSRYEVFSSSRYEVFSRFSVGALCLSIHYGLCPNIGIHSN